MVCLTRIFCRSFGPVIQNSLWRQVRRSSLFPCAYCPRSIGSRNFSKEQVDVIQNSPAAINSNIDSPQQNISSPANQDLISPPDSETRNVIIKDLLVYTDFITDTEEKALFDEVEPYLKRLKYESSHWDDAIHGYRETERKVWTQRNKEIIERVRRIAFPSGTAPMAYVHVLDLQASGVIKPHIDSPRFCGDVIAGISLLSTAVMRLVNDKNKELYADILLPQRSLYIMKDLARYDFTHEILSADQSVHNNKTVPRDRRIAIICRNEPYADVPS